LQFIMVLNNSSSIRFRSRHCSSLVFWAIALVADLSSRQQLVAATEETTTEASNRGVHGSSWSHDNGNTTKASENISPAPTNVTAAPANITNITLAPTPVDCESLHFDCYSCIQNGCFWCPTDGLCFETAEYVSREPNKDLIWPERFHNCKIPESFTQTTCTAPGNHFSDPLYSAQNWIFANVKVVPVWEKGYYGKGIRVRINDQGIETTHPEFFGRIDLNTSCPNGTAASLDSSHGMTVASIVGAAANNSRFLIELECCL
jgi:subtilisin family serine protease